jgi:hypothetical protein
MAAVGANVQVCLSRTRKETPLTSTSRETRRDGAIRSTALNGIATLETYAYHIIRNLPVSAIDTRLVAQVLDPDLQHEARKSDASARTYRSGAQLRSRARLSCGTDTRLSGNAIWRTPSRREPRCGSWSTCRAAIRSNRGVHGGASSALRYSCAGPRVRHLDGGADGGGAGRALVRDQSGRAGVDYSR